ncbi:MAG: transposase [bacterium]
MKTDCNLPLFDFQPLEKREVVASFNGGAMTSDAGGLLLREAEERWGIIRQFSQCFRDYRNPALIEHTKEELISQRVYGIALGYEDLNDHDDLRVDSLLAVLVGKKDPTGQDRLREQDKGKALAGKSTLNRLELTRPGAPDRYKKIEIVEEAVNAFFVEVFLQAHETSPKRIVLDLDATANSDVNRPSIPS